MGEKKGKKNKYNTNHADEILLSRYKNYGSLKVNSQQKCNMGPPVGYPYISRIGKWLPIVSFLPKEKEKRGFMGKL